MAMFQLTKNERLYKFFYSILDKINDWNDLDDVKRRNFGFLLQIER